MKRPNSQPKPKDPFSPHVQPHGLLPPIETSADLTRATGALLAAVAEGELTPSEAAELVDAHVKAIEVTDIQDRPTRLEVQKGIGETSDRPRTESETENSDEYQRGMREGLELAKSALKRSGAAAATLDRVTP